MCVSASLKVKPDKQEFWVVLKTVIGIARCYIFGMEDIESILQADFNKDACLNRMVIAPYMLKESLSNFLANLSEITFVAHQNYFKMKSYHDPQINCDPANQVISTEMNIEPSEFTMYTLGRLSNNANNSVSATICVKEFRAFVQLMETLSCQVFLYMSGTPGDPLLVNSGGDNQTAIDCSLVMATITVSQYFHSVLFLFLFFVCAILLLLFGHFVELFVFFLLFFAFWTFFM